MKKNFFLISVATLALILFYFGLKEFNHSGRLMSQNTEKSNKLTTKYTKIPVKHSEKSPSIDWRGPSMTGHNYPDVQQHPNLKIFVSRAKQRVYLEDNGKRLYTMFASTGKAGAETPGGKFQIEPERGTHFYNAESKEGANYWVSFKDHGIYLFHSVPVDANGNYIPSEAETLGKTASSHGCVRLSISDAKWMYENIRQGMTVIVS